MNFEEYKKVAILGSRRKCDVQILIHLFLCKR